MINRIQYLDGIRAISIFLVLIGHGVYSFSNYHSFDFLNLNGKAHTGVMIFFNISGFLITMLLLKERESNGKINIGKFYLRRSLRIFPVFYTYLGCVFILKIYEYIQINNDDFLIASTYLLNYKYLFNSVETSPDFWYIGHFWTLALEEQFYLFWPFLIYFFDPKKIGNFLPYILLLFPILRVVDYIVFPSNRGHDGYSLHVMADSILWGSCLALMLYYKKDFIEMISKKLNTVVIILILIFLFIITDILKQKFQGYYSPTISNTLEGICISLFLLYLLTKNPPFFSFLNNKILVYIGTLSYSLYIWQQLFLSKPDCSLRFEFPLNYILCFAAAYISFNTIEKFGLFIKSKYVK